MSSKLGEHDLPYEQGLLKARIMDENRCSPRHKHCLFQDREDKRTFYKTSREDINRSLRIKNKVGFGLLCRNILTTTPEYENRTMTTKFSRKLCIQSLYQG